MNKKQLEIVLSKLEPLSNYHLNLEQYQLEGSLAATLLWKAYLNGDVQNKTIADLGCGNGILGTGALLLKAKKAYFLDLDKQALEISKINSLNKGIYFHDDITKFNVKVDTVLMNPPFGVQQKHADKKFLEQAMKTSKTVYSMHKIESKKFLEALAKEHNFNIEETLEEEFSIKKTYKFHTQKRHDVKIGIWIFRKK